jgi:hypothetical protein
MIENGKTNVRTVIAIVTRLAEEHEKQPYQRTYIHSVSRDTDIANGWETMLINLRIGADMFVGGVEWLRLKMKPNKRIYFILHET